MLFFWSINRAVVIDGKDAGIGNHQTEVTSGDDLFAFDFVGSFYSVCAEADVGLTSLN